MFLMRFLLKDEFPCQWMAITQSTFCMHNANAEKMESLRGASKVHLLYYVIGFIRWTCGYDKF